MTTMSRPRTSIGTFGEIWVESEPGTRVTAYTWFRDNDGRRRKVQATGASRTQAVNLLKEKLARRVGRSTLQVDLSPDSPFLKLVEIWLDDLDLEGHLAPSTRHLYERNMRTLVLPAFKDLTLREITIMRVDRFLKSLAKESYSKAKQAKVVLNLALGLALRYEAIDRNPVTGTKRLRRPEYEARALKLAEIQAIRTAVRSWRRGDAVSGPKPDGQLEAIIELMLGTSGRMCSPSANVTSTSRRRPQPSGSPAPSCPRRVARPCVWTTPRRGHRSGSPLCRRGRQPSSASGSRRSPARTPSTCSSSRRSTRRSPRTTSDGSCGRSWPTPESRA